MTQLQHLVWSYTKENSRIQHSMKKKKTLQHMKVKVSVKIIYYCSWNQLSDSMLPVITDCRSLTLLLLLLLLLLYRGCLTVRPPLSPQLPLSSLLAIFLSRCTFSQPVPVLTRSVAGLVSFGCSKASWSSQQALRLRLWTVNKSWLLLAGDFPLILGFFIVKNPAVWIWH